MIKKTKDTLQRFRAPQDLAGIDSALLNGGTKGWASPRESHPIVLTCDENYAMPLATTLRSMVEANRTGACLELFVLTSGFSDGKRRQVLESLPSGSVALRWVPVGLSSFKEFSTQPYISTMTYARLLLPHIFPDTVSKVLYLDADVLVLDDLSLLWEIDLEGAVLGAVIDTYSRAHTERLGLKANLSDPGPDRARSRGVCEYFNAGVLLIDLRRWRQERVSERAIQYLMEHPQALLSDQDALNVVSVGGWKELDLRWNFQDHDPAGYSRIRPQGGLPAIIHFAGRYKPWDPSSLNLGADVYDAFRSRTQFARTPRDRLRDAGRHCWAWLKHCLKRYRLMGFIYGVFTHKQAADQA